jgi:hypothetical protein
MSQLSKIIWSFALNWGPNIITWSLLGSTTKGVPIRQVISLDIE